MSTGHNSVFSGIFLGKATMKESHDETVNYKTAMTTFHTMIYFIIYLKYSIFLVYRLKIPERSSFQLPPCQRPCSAWFPSLPLHLPQLGSPGLLQDSASTGLAELASRIKKEHNCLFHLSIL